MRPTSLLPVNIQLFADGGASAGASAGGSNGTPGATTQGESAHNALRVPDKAKHILDKMPKTAEISHEQQSGNDTTQTDTNGTADNTTEKRSFADLVKSEEYADEAQKYFDKAIGRRIAKYKGIESDNQTMRDILDKVSMRYGIDSTSDNYLEQVAQAIEGDSKLFEEEAMNAGMSTEDYVKVKSAERIMAQNRQQQEQQRQDELIRNHVANITQQAEAFKAQFPSFDLETEMNDPKFRKLVDPPEFGGAGISIENAYHALHHKEIMQATVSSAVNQATANAANAMQKNRSRPAESGMNSTTSNITQTDPSKLKLEDFKKIQEEYRRTGKRVSF